MAQDTAPGIMPKSLGTIAPRNSPRRQQDIAFRKAHADRSKLRLPKCAMLNPPTCKLNGCYDVLRADVAFAEGFLVHGPKQPAK